MNANRRMAECIATWSEYARDPSTLPASKEGLIESLEAALERSDPRIIPIAQAITAVVTTYFAAADLDLELTARQLIQMVAAGNQPKVFDLDLGEGEKWYAIVKRTPKAASPIIRPGVRSVDLLLPDMKL